MTRFADAAGRLAGVAGVLFGWRPDEFWRATPDELAALLAALNGQAGPPPPDRALMTRMQEAFPDG